MNHDRLTAWLALLDSGLSPNVLNRLIEHFGGPAEVLDSSDLRLRDETALKPEQCRRLRDSMGDTARRKRQFDVFHQHGMKLIERGDGQYPRHLYNVAGAPPALFMLGEITGDDEFAVALVGPRMATPYGLEVTRRFATEFAPLMTVVSGLALGIDTAAHESVLKAGGRTIGVAGCSLDQDYPKGNAQVREAILDSGAMISAYPPLTKPAQHHFPNRNALMSGIVLAAIVIEASEKSGALLTAHAALENGREVFAVPGDITRRNSRGTNALIAQGAGVATCAQDVLNALGPQIEARLQELEDVRGDSSGNGNAPAVNLPPAEAAVLSFIEHTQRQYDELIAEFVPALTTVGELATLLLRLELKGLVRQLPGQVYMASA